MVTISQLITNNLLKDVLEGHFNEDIKIINFTIRDATKTGDGFCSQMGRVEISYTLQDGNEIRKLYAIVKCLPDNPYLADFVREMFECEIEMYGNVLSKMLRLDHNEKIFPHVYYASLEPAPMVIVEDLSVLDYKTLAFRDGLDMDHCLCAIEKLAYYHAASALLHEQDPTLLPKFNQTFFRNTKLMNTFINLCYTELIELCKKNIELQKYVEKLVSGKDSIIAHLKDVNKISSTFNILTHGDFSICNIMFCYDFDENLVNLALIDFQNSCFTSPFIDLHFFLATSVKLHLKTQYKKIVDHYFLYLVKFLNKFHVTIKPTREDLNDDFRRRAYIGFGASIISLPILKATQEDGATLDSFVNDSGKKSFRYHCFNNEDYLKEVLYFLPFYDELGVFDI